MEIFVYCFQLAIESSPKMIVTVKTQRNQVGERRGLYLLQKMLIDWSLIVNVFPFDLVSVESEC